MKCYQQALPIRKEVDDLGGEGATLFRLGRLYFDQLKYDLALSCFLLAKTIFEEVQSTKLAATLSCMEELRNKIGEQGFNELLVEVEPQAWQVVEQALHR